jgi:hypothetical protein
MVYVYDDLTWEYKFIPRNASREWRMSDQELNVLGAQGWELAAVASGGAPGNRPTSKLRHSIAATILISRLAWRRA